MHIHLHVGVFGSGGELLLETLDAQSKTLEKEGVFIPPRRRLRRSVAVFLDQLKDMPPTPAERTKLFNMLVPEKVAETAKHALFIEDGFLGSRGRIFEGKHLYEVGPKKLQLLKELFEGHELSISVALQNPTSFLQFAADAPRAGDAARAFAETVRPSYLTWIPLIRGLRDVADGVPLTVWCKEEQLFVWPRIMRAMGVDKLNTSLEDKISSYKAALGEEGSHRLARYLEKHPPQRDEQFEKALLTFLRHYAQEDAFEETIDLPGWTQGKLSAAAAVYEQDMASLDKLEGVNFLRPNIEVD